MSDKPLEFAARVCTVLSNVPGTLNPCVEVPATIVAALLNEARKKSAPVQIKASLNGKGLFESTVVKYQGAYRLYLNTQMRKEAGVEVGNTVQVAVEYDPAQRMPPMPEELRAALNQTQRAREKWRLQPSSRRKEILAYLNSLKSPASLKRNVSKIVRSLLE